MAKEPGFQLQGGLYYLAQFASDPKTVLHGK